MQKRVIFIITILCLSEISYTLADILYYNKFNPYASTYNSLGALENPSIFGLLNDDQISLYYLESYERGSRYYGSVIELGNFGIGVNYYDTDKGEFLRYSLPFGFRAGDYMLLGLGLSVFDPVDVHYSMALDWYAGAYFLPTKFLSISVVGQNLGQPSVYDNPLRRRVNLGVGLKPLTERLEMYGDFSFVEHQDDIENRYMLAINPIRGIRLFFGISDNKDMYGGINMDLAKFGIGFMGEYSDSRSSYDGKGISFRYSGKKYEELFTIHKQVIFIKLDSTISDSVKKDIFGIKKVSRSVVDIIKDIGSAKKDSSVGGMILYISDPKITISDAYEIREAILDFRSSKRQVIAFMEMGDDLSYFIATAADKIILNNGGSILLKGLSYEMLFFKGFLDKIGVRFDVVYAGKYKTTFEPLTTERSSEERKDRSTMLIGSLWKIIGESIMSSRGFDYKTLDKIYSISLFSPQKAFEYRLIDGISAFSDITKDIKTYFGGSSTFNGKYNFDCCMKNIWQIPKRIAIIYLNGDIVYGKGFNDLFGFTSTGNRDIAKIADEIIRDESIRGVIVRINSPGGSVTGSSLIYEELLKIKKFKPVIVSVGSMAASGGYLAAIASDTIIANRTSLVGSIGVSFLKPDLSDLLKKLGIRYEVIKSHKSSDSDSPFRGLNRDELRSVEDYVNDFYKYFIGKVAEARRLVNEKVEVFADSNVYIGDEALGIGLIDRIGGYKEAIAEIKEIARIPHDMEPELIEFYLGKDIESMVLTQEATYIDIVKSLLKEYSIRDFVQYRYIK